MKVDFINKNGRVQTMDKRYADVLQKIGRKLPERLPGVNSRGLRRRPESVGRR